MRKQVAQSVEKPVRPKRRWARSFAALVLAILGSLFVAFGPASAPATAATSSYLNFQARLLTSTGAIVTDGTYNIDFKIYNADSTTGSVSSCSGACLWEETRTGANKVTLVNGYFSVNLGSVTSFPAINWDQQLYLTMNIGGTGAPSWDGEMQNAGHSISLTALPYAFQAGTLAVTSGANRGSLTFGSVTNNPVLTLPNETGTVCSTGSVCSGYAASTGGSGYIQNTTSVQTAANFAIQSTGTTNVTGLIRQNTSQTADLFEVQDANGAIFDKINNNGQFTASANVTINALGQPTGVTAGTATSGGSLTSGQQYFWVVSATNAVGESLPSSSVNKTPTSPNLTVPISWTQVSGATGYKIYRNTSNSFTSGSLLLTTITNGTTVSYSDTGTATGAGLPQTAPGGGNPLTITTYSGATALGISQYGNATFGAGAQIGGTMGSGASASALSVNPSASVTGIIIKGATSQTGDLQQYKDVNYSLMRKFDASSNQYSYGTNNQFLGLSAPTISSLTTSGSGGTLAANTYYYVMTSTNTQGETIASTSSNVTTSGSTSSNTLNWSVVNGATGYKIYRNTSNSFTSGSLLLTTITNGTTITYLDTGSATGAGLPPTAPTGTTLTLQGWGGQTANLLAVQNAAGNNLLGVSNTNSSVVLGTAGGGGQTGLLTFNNSTNSNTVSLQSGVTSSTYTWTLPTADASGCVQSNGSGTLSVAACGSSTLQAAYTASTSPEITVDATRGALTIQDASSPIAANLLEVTSNGGGTVYLAVDSGGARVTNLALAPTGNATSAITKKMNTSGTVAANDVVVIDTSTAGTVKRGTVQGNTGVFGIATGSGATQDIVVGGTYQVTADTAAVAIGDYLMTSATTGQATPVSNPAIGTTIGRALSSKSAGSSGLVWASVNPGGGGSTGGSSLTTTGGTVTYANGYEIHTFNTSGTFTVTGGSGTVEYLVVGGGGAGGSGAAGYYGGGGGAGGLRQGGTAVGVGSYPITVGSGGTYTNASNSAGGNGTDSIFNGYTATGGGGGSAGTTAGGNGGSGGGGSCGNTCQVLAPGNGNTPSTSPAQGYNGGTYTSGGQGSAGGGAGGAASGLTAGPGVSSSISGSPVTYATGGTAPTGSAPANTGNGGVGGRTVADGGPAGTAGATGVVIVRFLTSGATAAGAGAGEISYTEFTSSVSITANTEAAAQTVVTAPAYTFDGSTPYLLQFYSYRVTPNNGAGVTITLVLYDGSSSIGKIAEVGNETGASAGGSPVFLSKRLTPSAASHTYSIKAYGTSGTGSVAAGVDGNGNYVPGYIRIVPALGSGNATTLQGAYDMGRAITTTDARDILFTLADTTTDSNFIVNTASGSTSAIKFQSNGTDVMTITPNSSLVTYNGNIIANSASTATTGTTEATARTNVTTVTLTAAGSFANNDVIFLNNAGQDYYTRIVSGGGTTTLTVSPAVSYDISTPVTKYTAQNIGATASDYTTLGYRFFQGYFLGGVVTGAGSTTLSDGRLQTSAGSLNLQATGNIVLSGTATGTAATQLILPVKTDSGDPSTCTSGALYYNSNSSAFRGCTNSTWGAVGGSGASLSLGKVVGSTSANIAQYDVVVADSGANEGKVKVTSVFGSTGIYGINQTTGSTAAGGSVSILTSGESTINVDAGAVAVGDYLVTSGTSGKATVVSNPGLGTVIGRALTSKAAGSNGTVTAQINPGLGGSSGGSSDNGIVNVTTYTTGSGTYTVPAGVTAVMVEAVGGGAGGGGVANSGVEEAGGGGGGGYTRKLISAPSSSYSYSVGSGGTAGASGGGGGGNGGDTTFGTLTAKGGSGAGGVSTSNNRGQGGAGGVAGSGGDINATGGAGSPGTYADTAATSGNGGNSYLGSGAVGTVVAAGNTGGNYGGGGSGGGGNAAANAGGAGAGGIVIITEYGPKNGGSGGSGGSSGLTKLYDTTLGSDTANFDITNIPAGYDSLQVVVSLRSNRSAIEDLANLKLNNDSGTNYSYYELYGNNSAATSAGAFSTSNPRVFDVYGDTNTATSFSSGSFILPDYTNTSRYKNVTSSSGFVGASANNSITAGFNVNWASTAAVNRITLTPELGTNWKAGSRVVVYGVGGNFAGGTGSGGTAGGLSTASAHKTSDQAISSNTYTAITFDTEDVDTNNMFSTGANTKMYATYAGKYDVSADVSFLGSDAVAVYTLLKKNGTTYVGETDTATTAANYLESAHPHVVVDLAAGDYIETYIYFDNRTGTVKAGPAQTRGTSFTMTLLGNNNTTTLQGAYDMGRAITTTDARDINITLADTTTDSNFILNIATSSTGQFQIQSNGTNIATVSSTAITLGGTSDTTSIALQGTAAATYTVGNTNGTGTITLGQSTDTNTISIGSAITASAKTQTINIGNGAGAGTAVNVNILSGVGTAGTGTLSLGNNTRVTQIDVGNIAAAAARTLNIGSGANTVGVDTINIGTGASTVASGKTINIGNGAHSGSGTSVISIGATNGASSLLLQGGTGNVQLQSQGGTLGIGNNSVAQTLTIGNGTSTTAVSVLCGSGTCGFGNNAIDHSTTVGSTTTVSATTIQSGSGDILLNPAGTSGNDIKIGASDTTATLLVLDTKTGTDSLTPGTTTCTTSGSIYYNSADNQFRACTNGKLYNLVSVVDVQTFTGSGTWTKPSGAVVVHVIAYGGGGGGAGGTDNSRNATGGGGGARVDRTFLAADLGSTVSVTVGTGGAAGAANSSGGGDGNNSCFSSSSSCGGTIYVLAGGGGGGARPTSTNSTTGGAGGSSIGRGGTGQNASSTNTIGTGPKSGDTHSGSGTGGGDGGANTGTLPQAGFPGEYGGGGGGGGYGGNNTSGAAGGDSIFGGGAGGSGGSPCCGGGTNGGAGGGYGYTSGHGGSASGGAGAAGDTTKGGQGGAGGAGGNCTSGNGGTAGAAGTPGGGGAGGGSGCFASSSQNGTAGGDGKVWVISW